MIFLEKEYIRISNIKTSRSNSIKLRRINERMVNIRRANNLELMERARLKRNAIKGSATPDFFKYCSSKEPPQVVRKLEIDGVETNDLQAIGIEMYTRYKSIFTKTDNY